MKVASDVFQGGRRALAQGGNIAASYFSGSGGCSWQHSSEAKVVPVVCPILSVRLGLKRVRARGCRPQELLCYRS